MVAIIIKYLAVLSAILLLVSLPVSCNSPRLRGGITVDVNVNVNTNHETHENIIEPAESTDNIVKSVIGSEADFEEEQSLKDFERSNRPMLGAPLSHSRCTKAGGICQIGCDNGSTRTGLCPGNANFKCCIPNDNGNADNNNNGNQAAAVQAALRYFDANQSKFPNKRYVSAVDFNVPSSQKRFYLIDMNSRTVVETHQVAHGSGSDPRNTGTATLFSNVPNSFKSSLGAYKTGESFFWPKHGTSLRVDGLESSNNKARARGILVHTADYVADNGRKTGRSQGCFVLPPAVIQAIITKIKGGSLLYAYHS